MNEQQLRKFIRLRNTNNLRGLNSNLQFRIDAGDAGLDHDLLGDAVKGERGGYEWTTPYGLLVEKPNGQMELIP